MRLWKLEELYEIAEKLGIKNRIIIHECQKCRIRTPIPIKLNVGENEINIQGANPLIYKHNYCDPCNQKAWELLKENT